jgi:hypothetical protein
MPHFHTSSDPRQFKVCHLEVKLQIQKVFKKNWRYVFTCIILEMVFIEVGVSQAGLAAELIWNDLE